MQADSRADPNATPSDSRVVAALLGLALLVTGGYLAAEVYLLSGGLGFPLDDSWIHVQFARNLAAGDGLSYNPGEMVTGSTAPLWTALISVFFLLPGSVLVWVKALGFGLYLLGVDATYRLGRELHLGPGLAGLAAVLTLATTWMAWSAISGLEVPLFVALSLWGMILHVRERRDPERVPLAAVALSVAVLARPEGVLLLGLALLDRSLLWRISDSGSFGVSWGGWRTVGWYCLCAFLILGPTLGLFYGVGGSVLPTTFAAKSAGVRALPNPRYLASVFNIFFSAQPFSALLAGAGVLAFVRRLGGPRDVGLLPALWVIGLPLAYSTMSPAGVAVLAGNFGRYYFPLFPVLAVIAALGIDDVPFLLERGVRVGRWTLPVRALLVVLVLWPTASSLVAGGNRYLQNVENVEDSDVRMAHWLAERLPPEAVIAVYDVGALKYFLPNRVLDLAGIIHPEAQVYRNEAVAAGQDPQIGTDRFLRENRPDYLVVFPAWFPALDRESSPYRRVHSLQIRDNITMGGDELVVYSTPWTRHRLRGDQTTTGLTNE